MSLLELKESLRSETHILIACIEGAAHVIAENTGSLNQDVAEGLVVQGGKVRDLVETFYDDRQYNL